MYSALWHYSSRVKAVIRFDDLIVPATVENLILPLQGLRHICGLQHVRRHYWQMLFVWLIAAKHAIIIPHKINLSMRRDLKP